mgnify:CR=1 FL=1
MRNVRSAPVRDARFPSLSIRSFRTDFSTTYEIVGQKEEAVAWLESLKRGYHPAGYGTHGKILHESPCGKVEMTAYRSNSCD